jgi:ethanolamine utilization protein EutN
MEIGVVIGNIVATIKHPIYNGRKLLLVENVDMSLKSTGLTTVVVDTVHAGIGDVVLIAREGRGAAEILGVERGPVRSLTVGVIDRFDLDH